MDNYLDPRHNQTLITLVPKKQNASKLTNFRLISLCNVLYKTISKILTDILHPLMGKFILEAQGAFLPGRRTMDNIIIVKELFHMMSQTAPKKAH